MTGAEVKNVFSPMPTSHASGVKISQIFISAGHNFFGHHDRIPDVHPMVEVQQVECVAGQGLLGDRFCGFKENYKGQVTFFSSEVFAEVCGKLGISGISPGVTRRNVVTRGVDLNTLIGKEFEVQGVAFMGMSECSPCHWMNTAIAPGAEAALHGRGGLRARILTDGGLRVEAA